MLSKREVEEILDNMGEVSSVYTRSLARDYQAALSALTYLRAFPEAIKAQELADQIIKDYHGRTEGGNPDAK